MNLFDIIDGKVVIHNDALGLPPFKKLWEKDLKNKKHATDVISYIILKNKHDSPYVLSEDPLELETKLKTLIFNDPNHQLTNEELTCEKQYQDLCYTNTLRMLDNMRLKLDSISRYYKDSLEDDLDEKKIKDLLAGMSSVGNVYKSLDALEKAVRMEELANSKIKGGAEINPYEIPKTKV